MTSAGSSSAMTSSAVTSSGLTVSSAAWSLPESADPPVTAWPAVSSPVLGSSGTGVWLTSCHRRGVSPEALSGAVIRPASDSSASALSTVGPRRPIACASSSVVRASSVRACRTARAVRLRLVATVGSFHDGVVNAVADSVALVRNASLSAGMKKPGHRIGAGRSWSCSSVVLVGCPGGLCWWGCAVGLPVASLWLRWASRGGWFGRPTGRIVRCRSGCRRWGSGSRGCRRSRR